MTGEEVGVKVGVDFEASKAATDEMVAHTRKAIESLADLTKLPAGEEGAIDLPEFGRRAGVLAATQMAEVEAKVSLGEIHLDPKGVEALQKEIQKAVSVGVTKVTGTGYVPGPAGGTKGSTFIKPEARRIYEETRDLWTSAGSSVRPVAPKVTPKALDPLGSETADADEEANEALAAAKKNLAFLQARNRKDKILLDEETDSVSIAGETNAYLRRYAIAVAARTTEFLRAGEGGIGLLAQKQAESEMFEKEMDSRVRSHLAEDQYTDPEYAQRQGNSAALERLTALETQVAFEKRLAESAEENVKLSAEEAQLRRVRLAGEKAAAGDFSAHPERAQSIASNEALSTFNTRQLRAQTQVAESALYQGPEGQAALEKEAGGVMAERLTALRRNLEEEKLEAVHLEEIVKISAEDAQLRRVRVARERAAASDFSANPERGQAIASSEAETAINARRQEALRRSAESDLYGGAGGQAALETEAKGVMADRLTALKRSLEEQQQYSAYLLENAGELAQEAVLRKLNTAELERQVGQERAGDSVAAQALRENEVGIILDKERNKQKQEALVRAAEGQDSGIVRGRAAALAEQEVATLQRRLIVAEEALGFETEEAALAGGRVALSARVNIAEAELANRIKTETAEQRGDVQGKPGLFQRGYAKAKGIEAGDAPSAANFFGSRAVTTAGFALSGAVLYGGVSKVREMIKSAEELEKIMNQIEAQFQSLGKEEQFAGFRDAMLSIARETGNTGAEVATVGFQLQGAFGGDTQKTIHETESAFKAVKVTGLNITEVIDAFTALTQTFSGAGITIEDVTDKALGLQERFGVLAKETISFAADLAPVAEEMGFTVSQLEALGAVAQKFTAKSGSSLAEAFGRILPAIQAKSLDFSQLFARLPQLQDRLTEVNTAFRTGNIEQFFEILAQSYSKMDAVTQNWVITQLGGRREAAALIPVLQQGGSLIAEMNRQQTDAGKTTDYFTRLQTTLSQKVSLLSEQFKQMGINLLESGLGDFLKDVIDLGTDATSILTDLFGVVGEILDIPFVGSGIKEMLEALVVIKGIQLGSGLLGGLGGLGRLGGMVGLGGGGAAAAEGGAGSLGAGVAATGALGVVGRFKGAYAAARAPAAALSEAELLAPGAEVLGAQAAETAGAGMLSGMGSGLTAALGVSGPVLGVVTAGLVAKYLYDGYRGKIDDSIAAEDAKYRDSSGRVSDEGLARRYADVGSPAGMAPQVDARLVAARGGQSTVSNDYYGAPGSAVEQPGGFRQYGKGVGGPQIQTLKDLQKQLDAEAEARAGSWENIKDEFNVSGELDKERAAIAAQIKEQGIRDADQIHALASDPALVSQIATAMNEAPGGGGVSQADREASVRSDLSALETAARAGGAEDLQQFGQYFGSDGKSGLASAAVEAVDAKTRQAELEAQKFHKVILTADEAEKLFAVGKISLSEYLTALQGGIDAMNSLGYSAGSAEQQTMIVDYQGKKAAAASTGEQNRGKAVLANNAMYGSPDGQAQASLNVYLSELSSGKLDSDGETQAVQDTIAALKEVQDARVAATTTAADRARILAEGIPVPKEVRTAQIADNLTNVDTRLRDYLSGQGATAEEISTIIGVVGDAQVQTDAAVSETVRGVLANAIALDDLKLAGMISPEAKAALYQAGILVTDDRTKVQEHRAQSQKYLDGLPADLGGSASTDNAFKDPAAAAKAELESSKDKEAAQLDRRAAEANGDAIALARIAKERAQNTLRYARSIGDQAAIDRAMGEVHQAELSLRDAYATKNAGFRDYLNAVSGDDPVVVASNAVTTANEELSRATETNYWSLLAAKIRADKSLKDALATQNDGFRDYLAAVAGDDPIKVAQNAIDAANEALANATPGDYWRLLAAKIRADRSGVTAIEDLYDAKQEFAAAVATVNGDEVGAIDAQLKSLYHKRDIGGLSDTARVQLDTQIATMEGQRRDADLGNKKELIDYQIQMGQITKGQAIAFMQGLLQTKGINDDQVRDLNLAIRNLRSELGADTQFNLPSRLGLPTMYEVRRLSQSPRGSSGYTDNRVVSVTVNANTGASAQDIANAVTQVVGQPNRTGGRIGVY